MRRARGGRGSRGSRGRGRGLVERGNSKGRKNQHGNSQINDADLQNNSSLNLGQDSEDDFKSLRLDAATDVELDKSKSQDSFTDKKSKKKEKKSKKKSKAKHKKKEKHAEDTIGSSGEEDEGEESEIEDDSSEENSGSDDSEDPSDATTSGSDEEGANETQNSGGEEETREDDVEKDDESSSTSEDQPKNLKKKYQMKLKEKKEKEKSKKQRSKAAQTKDDQRGKSKKQTKKKSGKEHKKEEKPKPLEKVNISDERMKDMWKSDNPEKQTIEKISSRVYSFARKDSIEDDNPDESSNTGESESNSDQDDLLDGEETKGKEDANLFSEEKAKIKELEFVLDFLSKQNIQIRKYKKLTDKILKDKECPQSIKDATKSLQVELVQMVKVDVIKFVESSNNLLAILNNNTICIENLYAAKKISPLTFHKTMASLAKLFEKHKTIKLNFGTVWEKQK